MHLIMHLSNLDNSFNLFRRPRKVVLQSQLFTNRHFHFLVIVESAKYQVLLSQPKQTIFREV